MLKYVIMLLLFCTTAFAANQSIQKPTKTIVLQSTNTVYFGEDFNSVSVSKLMNRIQALPMVEDIYLLIDSPGGSVEAGLLLRDFIKGLPVKVHTITMFGASMGFITVQMLDNRYIMESGYLMSHLARGGFRGEIPNQLDSRYNFYLKRLEYIDKQVVKRTNGKYTLDEYRKLINDEYWCNSYDCVADGFADEVVNVTCGSSMVGTKVEDKKVTFMGMEFEVKITTSRCPLIGVLDLQVKSEDSEFENINNVNPEIRNRILEEVKANKLR